MADSSSSGKASECANTASATTTEAAPVSNVDIAAPQATPDASGGSSGDLPTTVHHTNPAGTKAVLFGSRALAAGGRRNAVSAQAASRSKTLATHNRGPTSVGLFRKGDSDVSTQSKYLVVGDGIVAPFMALCLRVHGLDCDLAHYSTTSDLDRGTIVLTPSITQLMGDVLNVGVPSGSVVGRVLTFDHVGNDMCDIDLNEFREKGESPTFFCCDRPKVENALLSLCNVGLHSCHIIPKPQIDKGGLELLPNGGVRVRFATGVAQDYLGVICTGRNQEQIPELTATNEELQQREENSQVYKEAFGKAIRWMEVCVPPLPELGKFEKRFTPGSQEIVEILTPRDAKMTVRPTMMATKLFYNVAITIPDGASDPRLKSTSMKQYWDEVIQHWTSNIPGYVSHTMFRPMFSHMQQHFSKTSSLVYRSPSFLMPHWSEGGGRVMKVGHAVHGSCFDAVDVSDAESFSDCFGLARALSAGDDIPKFLANRRLQVMEEMDYHQKLIEYSIKERGQASYMMSRFQMKILRKYKKCWREILKNYVTLMAKTPK
jgi:hypothetical protein